MKTAQPAQQEVTLSDIQKSIRLLKRQQAALQAREKIIQFARFMMPDPEDPNDPERSLYEVARHHDAIGAVLEEVERQNMRFLILTMPPRHGKSQLVSRCLPAWYLGRHPSHFVAVGTYSDEFAMDFGAEVRRMMQSTSFKQVFPQVNLIKGGAAKDRLQTTAGGMAYFVGVGGAMTGRGAHLLVIDDIFKDYEQARSKAYRDRAWDWFTKVAMTRRMGPKLVVITMTRWHADDIVGRLIDPENENYNEKLAKQIKIIDLPAIADEDDPLGREPGEPLWERYGLEFLEEQRALEPLGFEALYQQRPSVADGTLFRRESISYYDPADIDQRNLRVYCASDHAVGTTQRNDPSFFVRVGVDQRNHIYVLDVVWKRMGPEEAVEAMLTMARVDPSPLIWWAEKGHISKSIGPFLRKRMAETQTYFNLVEVTPAADKVQRAQSIAGRVSMGFVHFPKGAWWTEKLINEMLAFPNGLHDDGVDGLAYIGLGLQNQFPLGIVANRQTEPKYGTLAWLKREMKAQDESEREKRFGGF